MWSVRFLYKLEKQTLLSLVTKIVSTSPRSLQGAAFSSSPKIESEYEGVPSFRIINSSRWNMKLSKLIRANFFGTPSTSSASLEPCRRCVVLIERMFSAAQDLRREFWTIDFDTELYTTGCPFCRMLKFVTLPNLPPHPRPLLFLLSLENRKNKKTYVYRTSTHLENDPRRSSISGTIGGEPIARADHKLDVGMVKKWMNTCTKEHHACRSKPRTAIAALRLIDCETREVVLGTPDAEYVTLSYVWGKGSTAPTFSTHLPSLDSLPSTIEDALYITTQLGYQYLWIDRYCINQQDSADTLLQCEQMDSIYASSRLTIVAAAGDSPDYGLPGVGTSLRRSCAKVAVSSKQTMLAVSEPWDLINASVWNTRAWTYQEGYLSSRRLFFTDAQVFFECRTKAISESESPIWRDRSPLSLSGNNADYYFSENLTTALPWSIMDCIRRYCSRHLTEESDMLRAFLGILNDFGKRDPPVQYCWGIPIWDPALVFKEHRPQAALLTLPQAFCIGLAFDTRTPRRRLGFPSWSWTGWHGKISWHYMTQGDTTEKRAVPGVDISVELINGDVMDLTSFQALCFSHQSAGAIHHQLSPFIHITSWSVPLAIRQKEQYTDHLTSVQRAAREPDIDYEYEGWVTERFGRYIRLDLMLPKDTNTHTQGCEPLQFVGIYVGSMQPDETRPDIKPILLICKRQAQCPQGREDWYARVGSVHFEGNYRFDAAGERVPPPEEETEFFRSLLPDVQPLWGTFRLG